MRPMRNVVVVGFLAAAGGIAAELVTAVDWYDEGLEWRDRFEATELILEDAGLLREDV